MTTTSHSISLRAAVHELLPLVPRTARWRFAGLLALALLTAGLELALAGGIALMAAAFSSPENALSVGPLRWIREHGGAGFIIDDPRLLSLALLIGITVLLALKNSLDLILRLQQTRFSEAVGAATRMHVLRFYQRAPYLWLLRTGVVDLGFGLQAAANLANALNVMLQALAAILMLLALFGGLIGVSSLSSLLLLGLFACCGALAVRLTRDLQNRCAQTVYDAEYQTNAISYLALQGLKELRLYCRENALYSAYADKLSGVVQARSVQQGISRLPVAALELLGFSTLVGTLAFLIYVQDAGMAHISGVMGFMAAAAWRGLPMANRLVEALATFRNLQPYLRKAIELLALERKLHPRLLLLDDARQPLSFHKDIVLDAVSFQYPDSDAGLHHVSLRIRKGAMFGVIGLSGAGKSTLVNLLTGLIPPDAGQLFVDGVPVTRENLRGWLGHIGYVGQSPYIFDATLAENVALSRWGESIDRDRVLECCRMAALDFVDQLEDGIDSRIGERGVRLSGGQAQRVAIARALYNKPELIIFDEATSSLDMKNEKAIHETILSLRKSVTMVIIAHRMTTVENCDSIVWLDNGRVRMLATVAEVLPKYRDVMSRNT